jgi:hypothetical protein
MPRHDAGNTGRADMEGTFQAAPVEVWRYGLPRREYGYVHPVSIGGKPAFVRQSGATLQVVFPNGKVLWSSHTLGVGQIVSLVRFPSEGVEEALATAGDNGYALVDVAMGAVVWSWEPAGAAGLGGFRFQPRATGGRLYAFPQNTVEGYCYAFERPGQPRLVWHRDYPGKYWPNFGPYIVLADMCRRGEPDILLAGKPAYFAVIGSDAGDIKFDLLYPIGGEAGAGRPYGLLAAADLDGDGYPDAVMISAQVEKYIGIVKNEGGKSFKLEWSQWFEHELPYDFYDLRPNVTSLADLRGDGKREIVLGFYDATADKRWHTIVLDGFGGWKNRLADLPDRYFWGCYDLSGDGHPAIVTTTELERRRGPVTTLEIVDGRTFRDIATISNVSLSLGAGPLPLNEGFFANRETPVFPLMQDGRRGLLLRRVGKDTREVLMRLVRGKPVFEPFKAGSVARAVLANTPPEVPVRPDLAIQEPSLEGAVGAYSPLVCSASGRRELIVARTDLTTVGGVPDLRHSGAWKSMWKVRGSFPTVWQAPDGSRRVCAVDGAQSTAYVCDPTPTPGANPRLTAPTCKIALPDPPLRLPGMLMPYGKDSMRLFIGMQQGVHTLSSGVWDAEGRKMWYDPLEGPYPRQAAAFTDNGRWIVFMDNHGKDMLYDESGAKRTVAHGWAADIPGRGNGTKYALPIVGPFGPAGETRIVLSPGLEQLEVLNPAGERVAMSPLGGIYVRDSCRAAVGRLRGPLGGWDVGSIGHNGIFHCTDVVTAQDRWTMDLGVKSVSAYHIVAAPLEGSGLDDFLVAMPNGDLEALAERSGKGVLLWKKPFDAGLLDVIVADVDGDGRPEIIVAADDFTVRILRPPPDPRQ